MSAAPSLTPRAKTLVVVGTLLGLLVSAVNQTVVSTALPRIIGELGGLSLFSWVFTSYMLASTTTVPLVGKLGDMYGRKPFFMAGIAVFMLGSALAGLSQNMTQLIIFRGLQGFGAGALTANAFAVIGDLYAPSERGKYMGLFSAVFGLASIMGPTVGGSITDNLSWRWVFYVNIPFGLVALAVLWFGFPWVRPQRGGQKIDYLGVATLSGAVVPLLLGLVWGGDLYAWSSPQILALFSVAAMGLLAFIFVEGRAAEPIIPMPLFSNRVFVVATCVTFLNGVGMFGAMTFMPMFVQGVLGASATNSGVVTTPMMLGLVVSSTLTGQVVARTGKYRLLAIAGSIVLATGMYLLTRMSAATSDATAIRNMVIIGTGIGVGMPIMGLAVQNSVPHRLLGVVTSSGQFFRQIGGLLGVAIFGTLVTSHLRSNLQDNLPAEVVGGAPAPLLEQLNSPQVLLSPTALEKVQGGFASLGDAGPQLFEQVISAMRLTLSDALGIVFVVAFVIAAGSILVTALLPEVPLRTTIESADEQASPEPAGPEMRLPATPLRPLAGASGPPALRVRLEERVGTLPVRAMIETKEDGSWRRLGIAPAGAAPFAWEDGPWSPPGVERLPSRIAAALPMGDVELESAPRGWWERVAPPATRSANGSPPRGSLLFERWPRLAARHPWLVLAGTLAVLVAFGALFAGFGGRYTDNFTLPGTESQGLFDLLDERFPQSAGDSATVVVRAPAGLDDPEVHAEVESLVMELNALPDVLGAVSPYQQPGAISPGGDIASIHVQYAKRTQHMDQASVKALLDLRSERSTAELQVEAGGSVPRAGEHRGPGRTELIGIVAAVVILMIAFGSVVAMGLPILVALLALIAGFFLVGVGASYFSIPSMTTQFASMIGIGVGIDYALLIITRFREGLARGLSAEDSIVQAEATAGRSVVFAGFTVVIALLGLWAVDIPFVAYMGSAAAVVVALSVIVAVVVLPAALALAGARIDKWRIPLLAASAHESETGLAYRLSRAIQRTPLLFFVLSLGILLLLAAPVMAMRLGSSDAGSRPASSTTRRAYDLLAEGFGPGFNGPVVIGIAIDNPEEAATVKDLLPVIITEDGVAAVSGPSFNEAGSAATITVIPETAPQDERTSDLVHRLRKVVPAAVEGMGLHALLGGTTAVFIDVDDKIRTRMPVFFAAVIGLSFILLMSVFRSILIPLKAAVMNVLSVGAAYGVLVAVFQWGWFGGLLGVEGTGPIEAFLPMMMFAVLFGLSMDYEVFLVSRIQEEYLDTGDNAESVARGLSATTRVISAAAAIMIAVFLSFALSDQRVIKEFGMGLATAIFLDATLVRLVLVPSIMQLQGNANWWFPSWLDRFIPHIGLHSAAAPAMIPVGAGASTPEFEVRPVAAPLPKP